ncbi:uncharacterized protein [Narcine bancroftii]|uniref:uncharacterized protein isoform X2 n=1 Tax=Narcine bancroftii TaxID=1343680 RepID=UPI003831467B
MMFGRNGIFGIGSSWKRVVKQESSKKKVVLTKVTVLKNGSESEDLSSHPKLAKTSHLDGRSKPQTNGGTEAAKSKDQNLLSELNDRKGSSNCTVLKLYKSESEDSGAEFPSGANSPLTPSGSEQSLVIHRRVSSCDSGMALSITSMSPVVQPLPLVSPCPNSATCTKEERVTDEQQLSTVKDKKQPTTSMDWKKASRSGVHFSHSPPTVDERVSLVKIVISDNSSFSKGGVDHAEVAQFGHESLKRGQSNDSLDKYMEKCCRLSEANQDKTVDRGSGLGYLEHICQLIETIGQLQEQNKQLQKQVWTVERILKVNRIKEDFLLNHCSCGAFGIYQTLTNLPDLQNEPYLPCQGRSLVLESTSHIPGSQGSRLMTIQSQVEEDGCGSPCVKRWENLLRLR